MALNDPGVDQTSARKPRVRVLISAKQDAEHNLPSLNPTSPHGLIEAKVNSNNWYNCDRFSMTLRMLPPFDIKWWGEQRDLIADIQVGFLPNGQPEGNANVQWTSLIQGGVDQVDIDPFANLVSVEGRDLSYLLIEAKTTEEFRNKTSSEVITILAQRHGLTPVVTATSTLVERYYKADHTKSTLTAFHREQTEWDLATFLAQREQFDLFVTGRELHFQPKTPPNSNPFLVLYRPASSGVPMRANVQTLKCSRALLLAKDIEVTVTSWNSHRKSSFTSVARASGAKHSSAAPSAKGGATQRYAYVFPNLDQGQAAQKAAQILTELTQHEKVIEFDQPGMIGLTPRDRVRLQGTGSDWDQDYWIDSIERSVSFQSGFTQHVRAKNHDTQSQVQVS